MAKRPGWLEIYADSGGNYRWRCRAGNGKITDNPGESFASKSNAKRSGLKSHPELADRIRELTPQFK
jgi:uncharacterized protein YegP (UPF0339 family)